MGIDAGLLGTAEFDDSRVYRYSLTRTWGGVPFLETVPNTVCWIMLNPSTADETVLDPTIRRCVRFSRAWGYDGLEVVNVYAYRSSDPKKMFRSESDGVPITNLRNRLAALSAMKASHIVVVAWGGGMKNPADVEHIFSMAEALGRPVYCLGTTATGQPNHPLYKKSTTRLKVFKRRITNA